MLSRKKLRVVIFGAEEFVLVDNYCLLWELDEQRLKMVIIIVTRFGEICLKP